MKSINSNDSSYVNEAVVNDNFRIQSLSQIKSQLFKSAKEESRVVISDCESAGTKLSY